MGSACRRDRVSPSPISGASSHTYGVSGHLPTLRRSSGNVSRRYFLAAVVALFLARVLAADRLVPPWQGPDEPTHFSLTKLLASRTEVSAAERDALEARILESMARHGWWTAYQEPTPSPLPRTFREVRGYLADNVSRGSFLQPAYYASGAVVLRVAPAMSVDAEYEVLRLLSVTLAVATLLCAWAGTRLLFGDSVAAAVIALAALHPQFLLSALTVNPDALINLCGAIVWWQGARVYAGVGHPIGALLAVATAAVVAALSKRNGIPLIIVAVGISAIAAYRWYAGAPPRQRRWLLGAAAFGIVASGIALLLAGGAQRASGAT